MAIFLVSYSLNFDWLWQVDCNVMISGSVLFFSAVVLSGNTQNTNVNTCFHRTCFMCSWLYKTLFYKKFLQFQWIFAVLERWIWLYVAVKIELPYTKKVYCFLCSRAVLNDYYFSQVYLQLYYKDYKGCILNVFKFRVQLYKIFHVHNLTVQI